MLDRLFGKPEEISGRESYRHRQEIYLYRWILLARENFNIYLHHFVDNDLKCMHDHPKRFISIGLKGWYIEQTPTGNEIYSAPWIRSFPPEHIHRLLVPSKSCWTIVIVFKKTREWGFWHLGKWIPWFEYVHDEKCRDIAHSNQNEQA